LSNLSFKAIKGISFETRDAFFNDRCYQTTIMPADIFSLLSAILLIWQPKWLKPMKLKKPQPLQRRIGKHRERPAPIAEAIQW